VNLKLPLLLIAFVLTIALVFLARLFAPSNLVGWPETAAAALVSLLVFHSLTVIFLNKRKVVMIRYLLLGMLVLSAALYTYFTRTLLCGDVVVGTTLKSEFTNERSLEMNHGRSKCDIFSYVAESDPQRIWTDVDESRTKLQVSYLAMVVFLIAFFTHLAEDVLVKAQKAKAGGALTEVDTNRVFISYNHQDQEVARKLNDELKKNHIATIIDEESMAVGYEIEKFICESVQQSRITLSIVSEESMLSGWVATETLNTFFLQQFDTEKKFIACYLNDSFLDDKFTDRALNVINGKLDEINARIEESNRQKQNRRDLDAVKNRLYKLRNNLDEIICHLRESKCLDMRSEKQQESISRLIQEIKSTLAT
jgi:hypothetical protein